MAAVLVWKKASGDTLNFISKMASCTYCREINKFSVGKILVVLHDVIVVLHDVIVVLHNVIVVLHDVIVVLHDVIVVDGVLCMYTFSPSNSSMSTL